MSRFKPKKKKKITKYLKEQESMAHSKGKKKINRISLIRPDGRSTRQRLKQLS